MPLPPILHVDDASSWRGGEQQVLYLHRGLLERGHDSTVICAPGSALLERLIGDGLPHGSLPLRGSLDLASGWRLGRQARQRDAIVHTHTSHAHSIALWGSRLAGRFPLVVSRRVDFAISSDAKGRWKYRTDRVGLYLAISSAVETELRRGGVDASHIRRVPSGIDFGRFEGVQPDSEWRASFGLREGELLFGNVAALAAHKDQRTLIEAFGRYVDDGGRGHLVILGEGALRGTLEDQVRQAGLVDRVHLPGFTPHILPRMASLDVFVMSSYLEGLGTAILDALALGLPVVATAAGGIVDAVQTDQNGILVPARDANALARALADLADDPDRRARLGRGARETVGRFDVAQTVERTIDAYRELA